MFNTLAANMPGCERLSVPSSIGEQQTGVAVTISDKAPAALAGLDIAHLVREELARRRMTRDQLAHLSRISLSTLEKALSGKRPFTLATIIRIEEALGRSLRAGEGRGDAGNPAQERNAAAPDDLGAYSRPAVAWLEGEYLTLRQSFGDHDAVYAYRTDIAWSAPAGHLTFREAERIDSDFTQFGNVSVPYQSGHIYLVTNRHGQYRLIVVARPTINNEMHGILTTLQAGKGAALTPVATPIVLVRTSAIKDIHYGRIDMRHSAFPRYRKLLRRTTEEPFALFLPGR